MIHVSFPAAPLRRSITANEKVNSQQSGVHTVAHVISEQCRSLQCWEANERQSDASHGKPRVGCQLSVLGLHVEMGLGEHAEGVFCVEGCRCHV